MQTWRGLDAVPGDFGPTVVTVGVFDGVHRGHQAIISEVVRRARDLGLPCVAVTFDPHPIEIVRPGSHPPLLTTPARRAELLAGYGVDAVLVLPFDEAVAQMPAEAFVDRILVGTLHAAQVVVGANFRFGHKAEGNVGTLTELGRTRGYEVDGLGLVGDGRSTWSSTYVRGCLAEGDAAAAAAVLGRPHRIDGVVVRGDDRGKALGYPTANLGPVRHAALPGDGVYAGRLVHLRDDGATGSDAYVAAISVGSNPTFEGVSRRVEAYVLDQADLDLYGAPVGIELVERLRGMEKFASVDELIAAMDRDVARTREILAR